MRRSKAEKVSAMRTEEYFDERARRADPVKVTRILARIGKGNPLSKVMNSRQTLFRER